MRLYLLLLGTLAGLGCFSLSSGPSAAATATPRPTPTIKACHICDEEITPAATPTAAEFAKKSEAMVQAVMFWMDTCPHCHVELEEVLPPLQQKYGDQLQIRLIEVTSEETWNQLVQVGTALGISPDRLGVPFLVIGDAALMGSQQIPALLPTLIEEHLAAGGVAFPDLPGLSGLPPTITPTPTVRPTETPPSGTATPAPAARLIVDLPADPQPAAPSTVQPTPNGFGLALGIMVGMVLALAYTGAVAVQGFNNAPSRPATAWSDIAVPLLATIGLGVAAYLAYVETQAVTAVCGPVGDCNTVQASPYAKFFGILPVGVLGAIGYIAILAAWLWGRFGSGRLADYAPLAVFGMALFGVLFSLYLTYLEPFVIGAVCIWCLTSAVIITLLMLLTLKPALQVVQIRIEDKE